jgi:hypothetical protein
MKEIKSLKDSIVRSVGDAYMIGNLSAYILIKEAVFYSVREPIYDSMWVNLYREVNEDK